MDLDSKIQITAARIYEWYSEFDDLVYVSFSGGKDSTVLLDIVRRFVEPWFNIRANSIPAVFIDTGLEFPEIRDFVKTKENVILLKPEMTFRNVISTCGYPILSKSIARQVSDVRKLGENCWAYGCFDGTQKGRYNMQKWSFLIDAPFNISNKCCDAMKKKPAYKYEKESGRRPIIATMANESQQRKNTWLHQGCNAFDKRHPSSQPMSFWTEQDVLNYIVRYEIPYASVYGDIIVTDDWNLKTTLCDRTGCVFCGFGCQHEKEPNRFQRLKTTHPKLHEYCMRPWDAGGLGMGKVLDYINIKTE